MESLKRFLLKRSSVIFIFSIVAIVAFSYVSTRDVGKIYNKNYLYITALAGKSLRYITDIYYNDYLIYQNLKNVKYRINDVEAVYLFFRGKEYLYSEGVSGDYFPLFRKCHEVEKEKMISVDGKVLVCYPFHEELASELLRDTRKEGVFAILFDKKYVEVILKDWFLKNLVLLFLLFGVGTLIVVAILVRISENFRLLESMIRRTEEFLKRENLAQEYKKELQKFVDSFSFLEFSKIGNLIINLMGRVVELTQRLKEQAIVDALTGLYNRNYLEQFVDKIVNLVQRQGLPLAVAMIDIDNFKQVNDTYGHKKGDEVLRTLGKIVKSSVRRSDIAIRYGGEEILIIFPNSKKEYAKYVVNRIKERLKSYDFGIGRPVTFSAGIAGYPEEVKDLSSLNSIIEIADKKLYLAKKKGKDRIEL
ncbi:GGDEF domain-containing protein [Phorcysia thermohydrogeniphila]|uniref:diguanylate cyclase n=1 Tax=Phorcysia thermohydrogeniphila TaxID=936138 RepID=A0A4R1GEY8_9BACT|nr:GGDEF domain-containing protein [Phorcysia thermohydrogeniphila]TCK05420.1 diguanylate cyclase (GGDEF)-like protein [Phorcysia thermohydrogeniphila]